MNPRMKRLLGLLALLLAFPLTAQDQPPVWISLKPHGLVHGTLQVPVTTKPEVARTELLINGVKFGEQRTRSMVFSVPMGGFIRRLRVRAIGYDAQGRVVGEDEMVVNDPQPPFRIRLSAPAEILEETAVQLSAIPTAAPGTSVAAVDFYFGNTLVGSDATAPYTITFDPAALPQASFAVATARTTNGVEANDVWFWGSDPGETVEVAVQQLPLSVANLPAGRVLTRDEFTLLDNGAPRQIESLVPATDRPLNVILLIDSSESMLTELPLVKKAAKDFARLIVGPSQKVAVVGFAQHLFWMTGYTSDLAEVDRAVEQLRPRGQTHLYDAVIQMLYEIQQTPGRHAIVVLTDGVNQGGSFTLENLIDYARYAGVPVYPVVRNAMLSRMMKVGLFGFRAKKFAEMARDTGATYFIVNKSSDLSGVYVKIGEELRNQYQLVFYSQGGGPDEWHALNLVANDKRLNIRIPRGYFP